MVGEQGANAYSINSRKLHLQGDRLFVAVNEEVVVIDTKTGKLLHVLTSSQTQLQASTGKEKANVMAIQHFEGNFVCVGYSDKSIVVFDLLQEQGSASAVVATATTQKKPIFFSYASIQGHNESGVILIADKAGEVWASDLPKLNKTVKLLGHCASVLMDMTINSDCNKLVTADRDEKIRISNFPQTVLIDTYCLGHSSVVTSIATISPDPSSLDQKEMLLSTGWDHKILLWDMCTGSILRECNLMCSNSEGSSNSSNSSSSGGDVDDEGEKSYDETAAGNFPIRIVTHNPSSIAGAQSRLPLIAILLKDTAYVKVMNIDMKVEEAMTVQLATPPSDLIFSTDGSLILLMPAPIYLKIIDIPEFRRGATIQECEDPNKKRLVSEFHEYCQRKGGVNFTQNVGNIDEGGGLKKQTLDKRFLAEKLLARKGVARRSKSRGGKRRRKHKEGQQEGEREEEQEQEEEQEEEQEQEQNRKK